MPLHYLLSLDCKKYIPVFILNFLSKISPIVLFLTVISFWTLMGIVFLTDGFSNSESQPAINTESTTATATATAQPIYQRVGEARLGMSGEKLQILEADTKGGLGKIFVFTYDTGSIATTLSVENPAIISPDFRIVEGQKHDWLVTTTIKNSGTGFLNHIDTWYVVSYWSGNSIVLSYLSDSNTYDIDGTLIQKLTTDVSIGADDKSIEIKFIFDDCETQNKCTKTIKLAHYVWNSEKDFFVLDEKKSEITALEISNLM